MLISQAHVTTPMAARYLGQLCKHFQHKLPVTLEDKSGQIVFGTGTCDLRAEDNTLELRCTAAEAESLDRLQDVVARHLQRFAFRDAPVIEWQTVA